MLADFETRLRAQVDFPSPSKVAAEVISLARNPDVEMSKVANAISRDPAMAAKLLRIANSAFYAQRRPSQNIKQALVIIGLSAALTLALSFSLVSTLRGCKPNGIDYRRYWRRTLLAATATRAFAERACRGKDEDAFLGGLLQDVAILAIDKTAADFYEKLPQGATHGQQIDYEKEHLQGKDHAYYGGMLLRTWNLPESLCETVEASHAAEKTPATTDAGKVARCVALGSDLAEAALADSQSRLLAKTADRAAALLDIRGEQFTEVVTRVLKLVPEAEELYETSILDSADSELLMQQARELATVRSLNALRDAQALQETAAALISRSSADLEDSARQDPATGVLSRTWIERMLDREYNQAVMFGRSLSVAVVDIDHFKRINETMGEAGGNGVLKSCAGAIHNSVRGSDPLGRFNSNSFLVVLPGTDAVLAGQISQRILNAIRQLPPQGADKPVTCTVSIGTATYAPSHRFSSANELIQAADHALYQAKLTGRNRHTQFEAAKAPA